MGRNSLRVDVRQAPTAVPAERVVTVAADGLLALCVLMWTVLLSTGSPGPTLRWVVPTVLALMVVHRLVVTVVHARRRASHRAPRPAQPHPAVRAA